jgi:hypothetical protein
LSILNSISFQLSSEDDDLQAAVCQSSREDLKTDINSASSLLETLIDCAGPTYIILDGLDELEEIERGRLLRQLSQLLSKCEETRIMISSRAETDIKKALRDEAVSIRVDHRNESSIQTFINSQTQKWFKERQFLPQGQVEIERLLAPLATKSKGNHFWLSFCFIWYLFLKGCFYMRKLF